MRQNLLEKFKKERPDEFYSYDTPVTRFLGLNVKTVPDYVRKALLLVIDGKFIAEKVTHSSTYSSLWVPKHAHEHELAQEAPFTKETIEQRRAEAVKLLTDNGVTPEKPVKLRFLQATGSYVLYNAVAALVKEGTKGAIQFELDAVEPKIFFDKWKAKDFDVRASGQSTNSGHAIEFYSQLTCKSSYNSLNYCNPEFDKLVASASRLSEEKDRAKVWAQLATIVQNDAPVVPFGEGLYNRLVSPALGGFKPTFYPDLRDYYVIADKKPKSE